MKLSPNEFLPAPKPTSKGRIVTHGEPMLTTKEAVVSRYEQIYAEHQGGKHVATIAFERGLTKFHIKRIIRNMERGCYIQGPAK